MATTINSNIKQLANTFLDATVNKWGTREDGEDGVYDVLSEVHKLGEQSKFNDAVISQMSKEDIDRLLPRGIKSIVPFVLRDELSGSQLARAEDLYFKGEDQYRSGYSDYLAEGISSMFDLSETIDKAMLVGTVTVFIGISLKWATLAAVIGKVMIIGGLAYGVVKTGKNLVEIALSDTVAERKENVRDLGEGLGMLSFVGLIPQAFKFTPKILNFIKTKTIKSDGVKWKIVSKYKDIQIAEHPTEKLTFKAFRKNSNGKLAPLSQKEIQAFVSKDVGDMSLKNASLQLAKLFPEKVTVSKLTTKPHPSVLEDKNVLNTIVGGRATRLDAARWLLAKSRETQFAYNIYEVSVKTAKGVHKIKIYEPPFDKPEIFGNISVSVTNNGTARAFGISEHYAAAQKQGKAIGCNLNARRVTPTHEAVVGVLRETPVTILENIESIHIVPYKNPFGMPAMAINQKNPYTGEFKIRLHPESEKAGTNNLVNSIWHEGVHSMNRRDATLTPRMILAHLADGKKQSFAVDAHYNHVMEEVATCSVSAFLSDQAFMSKFPYTTHTIRSIFTNPQR
jgi:hypothetical protein